MPSLDLDANILLDRHASLGELGVVEIAVPARWPGPGLHHHAFQEAWYLLEGRLTFQLDDDLIDADPGSLTFARGGRPHTLANLTDRPARYLLIITPAGFERRFAAEGLPEHEAEDPRTATTFVGPTIAAGRRASA